LVLVALEPEPEVVAAQVAQLVGSASAQELESEVVAVEAVHMVLVQ
jgi:hypothetical protein